MASQRSKRESETCWRHLGWTTQLKKDHLLRWHPVDPVAFFNIKFIFFEIGWNFGYMVYPLLRSFAKRTPFPNMVGYWDGLLLGVPDCCCHGGTKLGNSQPRELNQLLSPDPISPGSDPTVVALSSCTNQLLAYPQVMTNIAIEHGT